MRATIMAIAAVGLLAPVQPGFAQGTSPSMAPKQQQAPVARRQPRPDTTPLPPPRPATQQTQQTQTEDEADARLNRALNSICRGC